MKVGKTQLYTVHCEKTQVIRHCADSSAAWRMCALYLVPHRGRQIHESENMTSLAEITSVCQSSVLSGRNVRWPRRMLPLVSHGEYANGTDERTDGGTDARPLHCAFH